jgi:preprotein translocase subunit SecA
MQHINSALRAHVLFHKDDNYIVDGDEVVIVDEFTGRTMPGRRLSDLVNKEVQD